MQKDAEAHADEDKKKKELIETKNIAEQLYYTAEKSLKDNKEKLPADLIKAIEDKMAALKTAKEGTDHDAIKKASEELSNEIQKIGEHVSKANQPPAGEAKPDENKDKGPEGNVRDAETK